ncbi:MAG: hypothetical protein ACKO0W_01980 [Planctomycetota bacterium]
MIAASILRMAACAAMLSLAACGGSEPAPEARAGVTPSATPLANPLASQPPADAPPQLRFAWSAGFDGDAKFARSADGTYLVAWQPVGGVIPEAEPFDVRVAVARVDQGPLGADAAIAFDAEMPQHGHGMNLVPTSARGATLGVFTVGGVLLHMPGRWVVAVDVVEDGVLERAQWNVDIE